MCGHARECVLLIFYLLDSVPPWSGSLDWGGTAEAQRGMRTTCSLFLSLAVGGENAGDELDEERGGGRLEQETRLFWLLLVQPRSTTSG